MSITASRLRCVRASVIAATALAALALAIGSAAAQPAPASDAALPTPAAAAATSAASATADSADTARDDSDKAGDAMQPGVLPTLGALGPGLIVRGLGHRIGGDPRTAKRLLWVQLGGLGTALVGAIPFAATGASRRLATPTLPVIIAGSSAFLLSWVADVYGSAGGPAIAGRPRLTAPATEAHAGYLYVYDPQFDYQHLLDVGARAHLGSWHLDATANVAVGADHQRLRASVGYRPLGPRRGQPGSDGSYLEIDGSLGLVRFGDDGFDTYSGELFAIGRYDLARMAPSLRGAFVDLGLGLGIQLTNYQVGDSDVATLLLAEFGFGVYLGEPGAMPGEVRVYYDHRRDSLASGASGFSGSFGVAGELMVSGPWGVGAQVDLGAALVAGASLLYTMP